MTGETPIEEFDAPTDLTPDELKVWQHQAPFAFKNRTLLPSTAFSFKRYCRMVVQEQNDAKSSAVNSPDHRGLMKQIEGYEIRFMLTPVGRPLVDAHAAKRQDEDDEFFGGAHGRTG